MTPGHEFIGEVVEANVAGDTRVQLNDRVAVDNVITSGSCPMCRDGRPGLCANLRAYGLTHAGGAAQFVDVPAAVSVSVGDLAIETAVLAEPTACVVHGLDVLQPKAGSDVLIIGARPTGQILSQLLGSSGAARVTIAAPTASKLEVARHHGAHETVTTRRGEFEASVHKLRSLAPEGFDVVVDATGAGNVLAHSLPLVRDGGTLMVYGMANEDTLISISPYDVFRRELTIKGAFSQTTASYARSNCSDLAAYEARGSSPTRSPSTSTAMRSVLSAALTASKPSSFLKAEGLPMPPTVLITGAANGIGRATALLVAQRQRLRRRPGRIRP